LYGPPEFLRCCRSYRMVRPFDRPLANSPEMKTSFFLKFRFWVPGWDFWVFSRVTKCLVMEVPILQQHQPCKKYNATDSRARF
jgi:hypothetical protein